MRESSFTDRYKDVINEMMSLVDEVSEFLQLDKVQKTEMVYKIQNLVGMDIIALAKKDPAALDSTDYVKKAYNSVRAVMYYRLAHYIYTLKDTAEDDYYEDDEEDEEEFRQITQIYVDEARRVSESGKVQTQIEIHPAAKIGQSFVIDHGVGTVIGETCEIGDNCYLLQGVILGASGIGNNPTGQRHPTLENDVEIGACARILGPIKIGHHTKINSYCVVLNNIPPYSTVSIVNQLQVTRTKNSTNTERANAVTVYGVVPKGSVLCVQGKNLSFIQNVNLINYPNDFGIDEKVVPMQGTQCKLNKVSDEEIQIEVMGIGDISEKDKKSLAMVLYYSDQDYLIITNARGLQDYVKQ